MEVKFRSPHALWSGLVLSGKIQCVISMGRIPVQSRPLFCVGGFSHFCKLVMTQAGEARTEEGGMHCMEAGGRGGANPLRPVEPTEHTCC